jgi:hypothetical protein
MENYTTADRITEIKDTKEKEAEIKKIILTNEAFALTEAINNLSAQISRLVSK